MVNDKDGPHGGPYGTGILGGHVVAMRTTKRVWIWLGLTALAFWAWIAASVGYNCAVYVFQITDLHVLADGVGRFPYIVVGLTLVCLTVLAALWHYRQLTEKGFYIAFGAVLLISGFGLWLYVDWSRAVGHQFGRYMIVIDSRPPGARSLYNDLGSLARGSNWSGDTVYVFPIDHTRLIRAHDRLVARGYEVHYEDTGLVQDIMVRYIRPYEDEPP